MAKRILGKAKRRQKREHGITLKQESLKEKFESRGGILFYEVPHDDIEAHNIIISSLSRNTNRNLVTTPGLHGASADFKSMRNCYTGHIEIKEPINISEIIATLHRTLTEQFCTATWKPLYFKRELERVDAVLYLRKCPDFPDIKQL